MLVASTRSFISDCSNGCLALALVISFILKFWRGQFTSDSHSCLFRKVRHAAKHAVVLAASVVISFLLYFFIIHVVLTKFFVWCKVVWH